MADERAILDIPDLRMLEVATASEHVAEFESSWEVSPHAVALPVLQPSGIPFANEYTVDGVSIRYGGGRGKYLGGIAHEFATQNLGVYLVVRPDMSFARSDVLHVVDIAGEGSAQTCFVKAATRRLLGRILKRAVELVGEACAAVDSEKPGSHVEGIVLDISDLWPIGGDAGRIKLNCFCQECRHHFDGPGTRGLVQEFERFPNPWNLVLKTTESGIGHINDFGWDVLPQKLINLSHLKGFIDDLKGYDAQAAADSVIAYMRARHALTTRVVNEFFTQIREDVGAPELRRVLLLEGEQYGWTSGVFLSQLDDSSVCDELWFNPTAHTFDIERVAYRPYMHRRSRYFVNALFDLMYMCGDEEKRTVVGLAMFSDKAVADLLEHRRRQAVSGRLGTNLDLASLPQPSDDQSRGRIGFVGNTLTDGISKELVGGVSIVPRVSGAIDDPGSDLEGFLSAMIKASTDDP